MGSVYCRNTDQIRDPAVRMPPLSCFPTLVQFRDSDSVQCTGCLALLALLRGEGPASDAAREHMEDGAVISTVAEGGLATYCLLGVQEGIGLATEHAMQRLASFRNLFIPLCELAACLGFCTHPSQAWRPTHMLPWSSCQPYSAWCRWRSTTQTCRCASGSSLCQHTACRSHVVVPACRSLCCCPGAISTRNPNLCTPHFPPRPSGDRGQAVPAQHPGGHAQQHRRGGGGSQGPHPAGRAVPGK